MAGPPSPVWMRHFPGSMVSGSTFDVITADSITRVALMRAWSAFWDILINCEPTSPKMMGQWISCSGASCWRNSGLIGGRAKMARVWGQNFRSAARGSSWGATPGTRDMRGYFADFWQLLLLCACGQRSATDQGGQGQYTAGFWKKKCIDGIAK
jgi:hypothetical protein